jgi:ABC-type antimicrobial peptide transport system permease subunit
VIGVVKDFHINSLHYEIGPVVIELSDPNYWYDLSIKISGRNIPETLKYIKSVYESFNPSFAFDYSFFDESFETFYKNEEKLSKAFAYFTVFAIFITSLGLFGLASFTAENRRKEVGIKKVLGATVMRIIGFFYKEFLILLIIANTIAWPFAYYVMVNWLQNFAYRIEPDIMNFAYALFISLIIVVVSIGFQVAKAATVNPVDSLRYE